MRRTDSISPLTPSTAKHAWLSRYPVKERIFIYYMSFFAAISLLTVLTNSLFGFAFSYNIKWLIILVFCTVMVALALRQVWTPWVHRIGIYLLTLVILPGAWLSSSGLTSPAIVYSIAMLLLINFLTTGLERFILNLMLIAINLALIALYYVHPDLYWSMAPEEQLLDWMANVAVMFVFIALQLSVLERAYERERMANQEKTERLERLSHTDPLTGVDNRLHLEQDIDACIVQARQSQTTFAVLIMDLDHFKRFNDFYGHLQGDECLKTIGSLLLRTVKRDSDRVYRFGGEEFLVLLPQTDLNAAQALAEQVRAQIKAAAIPHEQSLSSTVLTTTIGVAEYDDTITSAAAMIARADTALYEGKRAGRDQVCVWCA
ncbi:GGDEF domain-containing protein [Reinekea blandensis]|uniref:diguanylate cyclase n=1 Tax=Reinekea blandensis MED297 TaxID=314283 RepID=A4BFL1_9GAMM|nr:GGDEF domain-containing protein [Reinekea blandensis]EAR09106.1 diguanylate cyclase (GGDEF domain) [Reinekea sp. MED297] [Reinekea blandensis MED297]